MRELETEGSGKDRKDCMRKVQRGNEVPDFLIDFLEAHDTGRPIQLPLPMAI
jgi:hypothetical protein